MHTRLKRIPWVIYNSLKVEPGIVETRREKKKLDNGTKLYKMAPGRPYTWAISEKEDVSAHDGMLTNKHTQF